MLGDMSLARFAFWLLAPAVLVAACAAKPPPNWQSGGARLDLSGARWSRGESTIEIRPDGKVVLDKDLLLGIDAAGRVFETDGEPIAVLQPDGNLLGTDDRGMGLVGPTSASLPGAEHAWFTIGSRGEVVRYDSDGERSLDGVWEGCRGATLRTCALVTHVILLREFQHRPHVGIGFGVGIGVMR
jgi:hypothetical protein